MLHIQNQDSPPLEIEGVTGVRRQVRLVGYATVTGKYTLLTGNNRCGAAHYDLFGLIEKLRMAASMTVEPAPLADNPTYRPPEPLGSISLQGAAIDPAKWRFRKPLAITKHGAQEVELDREVLAHASEGLDDVRIVQAGCQIPFVLERLSVVRAVSLPSSGKERPRPAIRLGLGVKTSAPGITDQDLVLLIAVSPFPALDAPLGGIHGRSRGYIFARVRQRAVDSHSERCKGDLRLDLDVAPQGAVLYLETDNGDNAPMELDAFQGAYPVTRVIFKSGEEAGQGAWLYYGNQEAGPPSYDLGLIAGDLLRAERQLVTAGPEQTSLPVVHGTGCSFRVLTLSVLGRAGRGGVRAFGDYGAVSSERG